CARGVNTVMKDVW
nr:immunoglobulin heavy chain junction region [Macaca mulatta]